LKNGDNTDVLKLQKTCLYGYCLTTSLEQTNNSYTFKEM